MIVKLFRDSDLKTINDNLENIIKKSEIKKSLTVEPTIEEYKNIQYHVLKFIKEKKRIIYGGTAWDMLIKNKNKDDKFYDEYSRYDIDFYSNEPIKDLKELCDILATQNFKFIQGKNAFHEESYKINVNFKEYCNITYMPKYIFKKIDKIVVDGYYLIGNRVILIDLLRQFNDPINSFWRLNKMFKRGNLLLKYYPLKLNTNGKDFDKLFNKQKEIGDIIFDYICKDYKNYIFIDRNIMEIYLNPSNNSVKYIDYKIEVITDNLDKRTKEIYDLLMINNLDLDKLKVEEYYKFFQFLDRKMVFKYDDIPILTIYGNNEYCVPYNLIKLTNSQYSIMIGTFNICVLYLLINLLYNKINNNKFDKIEFVLSKLFKTRNKFLDDNNLTILDSNIYQDFKIECFGKVDDFTYKYILSLQDKSHYSRSRIPLYDPLIEKNYLFNHEDYYFNNCSGYINNNFDINNLN